MRIFTSRGVFLVPMLDKPSEIITTMFLASFLSPAFLTNISSLATLKASDVNVYPKLYNFITNTEQRIKKKL